MGKISNMKMRLIFIGMIVLIMGILFYCHKSSRDLEMTKEIKITLFF